MSLHPQTPEPIPEDTARCACVFATRWARSTATKSSLTSILYRQRYSSLRATSGRPRFGRQRVQLWRAHRPLLDVQRVGVRIAAQRVRLVDDRGDDSPECHDFWLIAVHAVYLERRRR